MVAARCPTSCSLTSSPQQDKGREDDQKFIGQDKGTLMKEALAAHGSKAKKVKTCSPLPISR